MTTTNTTTIKFSLVLSDDGSVDVEASYTIAKSKIDAEALWASEGFNTVSQTLQSVAKTLKLDTRPLQEEAVVAATMRELGQVNPEQHAENARRVEEVLASLKGKHNENHKPFRSVRGPSGGLSLWTDSSREVTRIAEEAKAAKAARSAK